jgi:L-ascorbate metabolism protein UlaG (beta-lactamase superfamily)
MQVEWYGQSAFCLSGEQATVFIDPFGDVSPLAARGMQFEYPAISDVRADLVLVTHEHLDHNGVDAVAGDPAVLRSTAGRLTSPIGDVVAIASEHDDAAGTQRGPNTIFAFELDGVRVCHFGDFGQGSLRERQREAIGHVDLLFLPVGGGPTIGAEQAVAIAEELAPRWIVPMHYRTPRIGFLEPADGFLERMPDASVARLYAPAFDTAALSRDERLLTVLPAVP